MIFTTYINFTGEKYNKNILTVKQFFDGNIIIFVLTIGKVKK